MKGFLALGGLGRNARLSPGRFQRDMIRDMAQMLKEKYRNLNHDHFNK